MRRLAPVLLGLGALLAPAPLESAVDALYGGEAVRGHLERVRSLDPLEAESALEYELLRQIHAGLYESRPDGSLQPLLASGHSLEQQPDGSRRLVVRLRSGLRFHDERPLTAEDVIASLRRWLRRDPQGPASLLLAPTTQPDRAPELSEDGGVLSFALAGSARLALAALASPRAAVLPGGRPQPGLAAVGAGPFRLAASGEELRLEPFLHFVRGRPFLDQLRYRLFADPRALLLAHRFSGAQLIALPAPLSQDARAAGSRLVELPDRETVYLLVAPQALGGDPLRRRTLSEAIDRNALVDVVLRGEAEPAWGLLPGYPLLPSQLLRAAPAPPTGETPAATQRPLELVYALGSGLEDVAERLLVDLHARGIEVRPRALEQAQLARLLAGGRYDLALETAPTGGASAVLDLLYFLEHAGIEITAEQRRRLYQDDQLQQLTRLQLELAERVEFLLHRKRYLLVSEELHGLSVSPDGSALFEDVWTLP